MKGIANRQNTLLGKKLLSPQPRPGQPVVPPKGRPPSIPRKPSPDRRIPGPRKGGTP